VHNSSPEFGGTARTVIIVPCYNEAGRLPSDAFRKFLTANPRVDFIFVNDGSSDGTLAVLQTLHGEFKTRVHVLDKAANGGKAAAVRDGMLATLQGEPEIVGFWDADLATPLEAIDSFLQVLDSRPEVEMVFGSRVQLLGRQIQRRAIRHYLGRIFATFASMVLHLPIYDTQCGAKLFRATPQLRAALREPFISGWIFDVELIARFLALSGPSVKDRIYEYPLQKWVDVAGSKVRAGDFFRAFLELVAIRRRYF